MSREPRRSPAGSPRAWSTSRLLRARRRQDRIGRSLVLSAALASLLWGCGDSSGMAEEAGGTPTPVRTAVVTVRDEPVRLTYAGEVVASNRYDVASKAMGNVTELPVTEGTHVARGDLIARVDAPELTASLGGARAGESAARTAMNTAKRHAERFRRLAAEGVVTPRDLELAEIDEAQAIAAHETAKAQLVVAERNITYAEIRAPVDGVVVDRLVRLGDLATPGRPLAVLEDEAREIRVSIPAELGPDVAAGDAVSIQLTGGRVLSGHVDRVAPDASRHVRELYVRADDLAAPSGTFVTVGITGDMVAPSLIVPADALRRRGSLTSVFVAQDDRAVLRYVRLDEQGNVVAGLDAGEAVVIAPPSTLEDGHAISVTGAEVAS